MTYTTHGSVRGGCGHRHRTAETAERCLRGDQDCCSDQGGYSDRQVVVIGVDDYLYRDENCQDWVPCEGGPSHGAERF